VAEERFIVDQDNLPIFSDFLGEAPQLLAEMEGALIAMSRQETGAGLDPVLRSLHTLKGIFGFLGLDLMHSLCHRTESSLEPFRSGNSPDRDAIQAGLSACDMLRAQMTEIRQGLPSGSFKLVDPEHAAMAEGADRASESYLRVRIEKMNALFELVGEMAICQAQVSEGLSVQALPASLQSEVGRLGKISRELQQSVQALRLVPVEPLFLRASRMAHDLSQKTGKAVQFECEGRETELDKGFVEELSDPLVHLIRNAMDHGLEDSQERLACGKPEAGRLVLRASHQGGEFVLELQDDGRGMDMAKLAQRGLALGLLSENESQDPERLKRLIFESGFSTAQRVTDLSGRGVGLDAVRARIASMKGDIHVETTLGKGSRFIIRLPLTLALVDGIMVSLQGERYVVPAAQVLKFVALDQCRPHSLGDGSAWLQSGEDHLPLIDFKRPGTWDGEGRRPIVLQVQSLGRQGALIVDQVLGKQQVVAKGLEGPLQGLRGVSGAAILGDGKVSLILDLESLMEGSVCSAQ
jgi:two-component system chemotaxis sensor kinase CheA